MSERNVRVGPARVVAGAIVAVAALVAAGTDLRDPDIWWNTVEGLYRLAHGALAEPPPPFFGAHGCDDPLPLVTTLPVMTLALAWKAGGLWALVVVRTLLVVVVGLAVLFAPRARQGGLALTLQAALAIATVGSLSARASARPELFAVALLALGALWLTRFVDDDVGASRPGPTRLVLHLVPGAVIAALLVWTHSLAIAFAPMAGVVAFAALLDDRSVTARVKRAAAAFAVAAVASVVARPGVVFVPLQSFRESGVARALGFREFQSLWSVLHGGYRPPALACAAVIIVLVVAAFFAPPVIAHRKPWRAVFLVAVACVGSANAIRGVVLFAAFAPAFAPAVVDALSRYPVRVARFVVFACGAAFAFVVVERADDPIFVAAPFSDPTQLVPSRLNPLGPGRWLSLHEPAHDVDDVIDGYTRARPLVYAPLHANWLMLSAPGAQLVWTGRRTYSLACGLALLHGRAGGKAFDDVDARLHPSYVLADIALEQQLVHTVLERGFHLVYVDAVWGLFSRDPDDVADDHIELARVVEDGLNRPIDGALLGRHLDLVCDLVKGLSGSGAVCAAAARLTAATTGR